tara:strand:+ start:3056 stop:3550 length:495 start_codon:yes stop_codon:yes gene_type:complete
MSWQNILKNVSDFQLFLSEVFDISHKDSQNIKASKSLMQAISSGKFLNMITEKEFDTLMNLAQAKMYEKLVESLEFLYDKSVKERGREYRQRPEVIERTKKYKQEYRQRPEVKERRKKYSQEYEKRPEVIERRREYEKRPEVKERKRQQQRKRYRKRRNKERLQ